MGRGMKTHALAAKEHDGASLAAWLSELTRPAGGLTVVISAVFFIAKTPGVSSISIMIPRLLLLVVSSLLVLASTSCCCLF